MPSAADELHVVSINAQGSGGDELGIRALLSMVAEVDQQWAVVFISESDFFAEKNDQIDLSPHLTWRHYPGEGSRAMRFVLRRDFTHLFQSIQWQGRCGLLTLSSGLRCDQGFASFLGVHGAHGDLLEDTLAAASCLLGLRRPGTKTLVLGDTNVDFLPMMEWDPWREQFNRRAHHSDRRDLLCAWADASGLAFEFPASSSFAPPGKWQQQCKNLCISRIPSDLQLGLPALLDYGVSSRNFVSSCMQSWFPRISDHASTVFVVRFSCHRPRFSKTTWRCNDVHSCESWIRSHFDLVPSDSLPQRMRDVCMYISSAFCDSSTCRMRRRTRMPFQLRDVYARIKQCTDSNTCATMRKHAFQLRKKWLDNLSFSRIRARVVNGGVLAKSKKLFQPRSIDGATSQADMCRAAVSHFGSKWGTCDLQMWEHICDFVHATEGKQLSIHYDLVRVAFNKLRKPFKLDRMGICVQMLRHVFHADAFFVLSVGFCLSLQYGSYAAICCVLCCFWEEFVHE